jgi:hypothetical protein
VSDKQPSELEWRRFLKQTDARLEDLEQFVALVRRLRHFLRVQHCPNDMKIDALAKVLADMQNPEGGKR